MDTLRTSLIFPPEKVNRFPCVIVGVGSIGSFLAESLTRLGVNSLTLIDPDTVNPHNVQTQGFLPSEVGQCKVTAIKARLESINPDIQVIPCPCTFEEREPIGFNSASVFFSCVDSMEGRKAVLRRFSRVGGSLLIDSRMSEESLQVYSVPRDKIKISQYKKTLFSDDTPIPSEYCTRQQTLYTVLSCVGIVTALFKRFSLDQTPLPPRVGFDCLMCHTVAL